MKRVFVVFACILALNTAAEASFVSPMHIVPVVAKVAGAAGTDWMTSMSVSNVTDGTVEVTAMFFRENSSNTPFQGPTHLVTIGPGDTLTVADVLGEWFPAQGNTKGFLMLLAEPVGGGPNEEALLAVTARIFNNANPNATYGQAVSSSLFNFIFGRGVSVLPGAAANARTRSNVGVVNLSAMAATYLIKTYAAGGAVAASVTKQVPAFSMAQWSMSELGVSNLGTPGRVEVTIDPGTITWDPCDPSTWGLGGVFGMFVAYISQVDQATGDAIFALGQNDWTEFVFDCGEEPDPCLKRQMLSNP
jgi:hypothetical protein